MFAAAGIIWRMDQELVIEIEQLIIPILAEEQVDLVSLRVLRKGKSVVIDILTDKPAGGITLDQCGVVNKKIVAKIESENAILQDYCLMVSSPGVDWPLKTKKDFLRVLHHEIRFFLSEAVQERQEYVGILESVTDTELLILSQDRHITIPLSCVKKAIQVV